MSVDFGGVFVLEVTMRIRWEIMKVVPEGHQRTNVSIYE
jgi:hypothetical protein